MSTEILCPYCGKEPEWVPNEEVYGKRYGASYMCYLCRPCGAYVGCHQNTRRPLGTMANKELREWRMKVHHYIDPIWKGGLMKRKHVYRFLCRYFGRQFHVGESTIEDCKQVLEIPLTSFE